MSNASYQKQHLVMHAAGFINAAGTTQTTFGCQMTRSAAGVYAVLLGDSDGLVDNESFTFVTVKGAQAKTASVDNTSNRVKTIRVFGTAAVSITDGDIEVALFKSVTR